MQARKQEKKGQEASKGGEPSRNQPGPRPKCDNCGKSGHRTQDCWGGSGAARAGPHQPAAGADKFKEMHAGSASVRGILQPNARDLPPCSATTPQGESELAIREF